MRCSCGAYPPEDARFCHKCGRPLYEPDVFESATDVAPAVAPAPPLPTVREAVINFRNRTAVGVSVMAAAVTLFLLIVLTLAFPSSALVPFLFCGGGFFAALLYAKASGERLSPQNGARMGFMTCLWGCLVMLVFTALMAALIANPDIRHSLQTQMEQLPQLHNSPQMAQTLKILENPSEFVRNLALAVGMTFLIWTLFSMLGGMIGARLSRRTPSRQ